MRKRLTKFAQVAGIMLALVFTYSCSDDKDEGGGNGGGITFKDDRDGKSYKYVEIGEQTWMAENLNYRGTEPDTLGRCYGDDPANCKTYGRLYNWAMANTVCPSGWHLPSEAEWDILMTAVDRSSTALKAKSGWSKDGQPTNGTDDYGFSALPGGYVQSDGGGRFQSIGSNGGWWSSSEHSNLSGTYGEVTYWAIGNSGVSRYNERKSGLYSVRCIKDQ